MNFIVNNYIHIAIYFRYDLMTMCWMANANERPQFADIRQTFAAMLEKNGGNYGYVKVIDGNGEGMNNKECSKS